MKQKEEQLYIQTLKQIDNIKLLQPTMRFRARTDLERIFDSINGYSYGRASKKILNRQLKDLDLNFAVKNDRATSEFMISKRKASVELLEKDSSHDKRKKSRKTVDNSEAKNIMSELHLKTHFKAASVYTIQNNRSRNIDGGPNTLFDEEGSEVSKTLKKHQKTLSSNQDLFEYKRSHVLDSLNVNPFHNNNKSITGLVNHDKLSYLQTISNLPSLNQVLDKDNTGRGKKVRFANSSVSTEGAKGYEEMTMPVKIEERKKDEEIIMIDNKPYNKNQFDIISKIVLKKCNFTHEKNKNNNKMHKTGEGKQMITSGMTVHDFVEKHHLPNIQY